MAAPVGNNAVVVVDDPLTRPILLAVSGGGVRASAFAAGFFKRFNAMPPASPMSPIERAYSVSGGGYTLTNEKEALEDDFPRHVFCDCNYATKDRLKRARAGCLQCLALFGALGALILLSLASYGAYFAVFGAVAGAFMDMPMFTLAACVNASLCESFIHSNVTPTAGYPASLTREICDQANNDCSDWAIFYPFAIFAGVAFVIFLVSALIQLARNKTLKGNFAEHSVQATRALSMVSAMMSLIFLYVAVDVQVGQSPPALGIGIAVTVLAAIALRVVILLVLPALSLGSHAFAISFFVFVTAQLAIFYVTPNVDARLFYLIEWDELVVDWVLAGATLMYVAAPLTGYWRSRLFARINTDWLAIAYGYNERYKARTDARNVNRKSIVTISGWRGDRVDNGWGHRWQRGDELLPYAGFAVKLQTNDTEAGALEAEQIAWLPHDDKRTLKFSNYTIPSSWLCCYGHRATSKDIMGASGAAISFKMGRYTKDFEHLSFLQQFIGANMGSWLVRDSKHPKWLLAGLVVIYIFRTAVAVVPAALALVSQYRDPEPDIDNYLPWFCFFLLLELIEGVAVIFFPPTRLTFFYGGSLTRVLFVLLNLTEDSNDPNTAPVLFLSDGGHFENIGGVAAIIDYFREPVESEAKTLVMVDSGDDADHAMKDLSFILQTIDANLNLHIVDDSTDPSVAQLMDKFRFDRGREADDGDLRTIRDSAQGTVAEACIQFTIGDRSSGRRLRVIYTKLAEHLLKQDANDHGSPILVCFPIFHFCCILRFSLSYFSIAYFCPFDFASGCFRCSCFRDCCHSSHFSLPEHGFCCSGPRCGRGCKPLGCCCKSCSFPFHTTAFQCMTRGTYDEYTKAGRIMADGIVRIINA